MSNAPIVLLLSGVNLNLLGDREPEIYGTSTLADHVATATAAAEGHGLVIEHLQSNAESELVDAIHGARRRCAAIIFNPDQNTAALVAGFHFDFALLWFTQRDSFFGSFEPVVMDVSPTASSPPTPARKSPPSPPEESVRRVRPAGADAMHAATEAVRRA